MSAPNGQMQERCMTAYWRRVAESGDWLRALLRFFYFHFDFSVLTEVVQGSAEAAMLLDIESNAGVEGLGIDMKADAARPGCIVVFDLMDGLQLVDSDDLTSDGTVLRTQPLQLDV